jgi:hypothetical protein
VILVNEFNQSEGRRPREPADESGDSFITKYGIG